MKGTHQIRVSNNRLIYNFVIRRNITIIKGNSATGKTTLVEMIREYYENGENSGIMLHCDKECRVIGGRDWKTILDTIHDSIVFIDEDNAFLPSDTFAEAVRNSDNYYVIVTREGLPNLPYSVTEIYGLREAGKYASFKQIYNEMYRIYGNMDGHISGNADGMTSRPDKKTTGPSEQSATLLTAAKPDTIIVEDTNAGYDFYSKNKQVTAQVVAAHGKSDIFHTLLRNQKGRRLIIADGAAFGPEMDRVMKEIRREGNVQLFLPE